MDRIPVLVLALALGCGPVSLAPETETTTDTTGEETGEPPMAECVPNLFALVDTVEHPTYYLVPTQIVARDDGSIVTIHTTGTSENSSFHLRAWTSDGDLIWERPSVVLENPGERLRTFTHDEAGDLYLSHYEAGTPAYLTKLAGDGGAELWTYATQLVLAAPNGNNFVTDVDFDAEGRLFAAMNLNNGENGMDIVVQAIDPDDGTALDWYAQWDGPNDFDNSNDLVGGLAVDSVSGRVFAAAKAGDSDGTVVVLAWDPPSTSPTWMAYDLDAGKLDEVLGLELTSSGRLIVLLERYLAENQEGSHPHMLAVDPDDGSQLWSADAAALGFGTNLTAGLSMASADEGVVVSGLIPPDDLVNGQSAGFLLRLDGELSVQCLGTVGPDVAASAVLLDVAADPSGNVYTGGWAQAPGTITNWDFAPLVLRWD